MNKGLPCFIFAIADEDRSASEVHECETEYDALSGIRELVRKGYPIDSILWVPMDDMFHIKFALSTERKFDHTEY